MSLLPPVIVELRASIEEFQKKMAEARGETEKTATEGSGHFSKLGMVAGVALAAVGSAAVGAGALAVHMADEFESAHARLEQSLTNVGSSMDKMSGQVGALGKHFETYGYNIGDTQDALARMTLVTGNAQSAMKDMQLAADIAAGRHMDLAKAVDLVGKVQDGNFGQLKRYGIMLDEHTIKSKDAAAALKELSDRFSGEAQAQADTFGGKVEHLNAVFQDLLINLGMDIIPVLMKLADAALWAYNAFSDNWPQIQGVLGGVVDYIWNRVLPVFQTVADFAAQQWPRIVAIAQTVWGTVTKTLTDAWPRIQSALSTAWATYVAYLQGLWNAYMTYWNSVVVPVLMKVIDVGRSVVQWVVDNWPRIKETAVDVWRNVVTALEAARSWIMGTLVPDLQKAWQAIVNAVKITVDWIQNTGVPALQSAWQWIQDNTAKLVQYISDRWDDIKKAVENVLSYLVMIVGIYLAPIIAIWQSAHEQIMNIVMAVWDAIKVYVEMAINAVKDVIDIVLGLLSGDWGRAWDGVKAFVSDTWEGIKKLIADAWTILWNALQGGLNTLGTVWQTVWDTAQSVLSTAWDTMKTAVSTAIGDVVQFFKDLPGHILDALGDLGSFLLQKGKDLLKGLQDGVNDKYKDLKQGFEDLPGNIVSAIGDLSSLLWDKGKQIVQGLIDGITSLANGPADAVKAILSKIPGASSLINTGPAPVTAGPSQPLHNASGGLVTSQSLSWLGENGPEMVLNSQQMTSLWSLINGGGRLGGGSTINVYVQSDADPWDIANEVAYAIR